MEWQKKIETRPPELNVAMKEFEPDHGRQWREAVARITPEQIANKLRYRPEYYKLLKEVTPDSKTECERLADKYSDDAIILAAVAKFLRDERGEGGK